MKTQYLVRQSDILPAAKLGEQITIIGAGAIGSFTCLQLAKMGFENITVIDADTVSDENMSNQFFRISDIGKEKTIALRELVHDFTGVEINVITGRYTGGVFPGIVIVAVDNMETRKLVYEEHALMAPNTRTIIDPRMGAEFVLLYSYSPNNAKECEGYAKTLYSDDDAMQERCTAKATMYTVNLLSGVVARNVKTLVTEGVTIGFMNWCIKSFDMTSFDSLGNATSTAQKLVKALASEVKELRATANANA
jgi:molybdopterin/thiamine biosynthesis adenylyltransferase